MYISIYTHIHQGDGGLLKYFKKHGEGPRAGEAKVRVSFKVTSSCGACILDKQEEDTGTSINLIKTTLPEASQMLFDEADATKRTIGVEVMEESIRSVLRSMRVVGLILWGLNFNRVWK